MLKPLKFFIPHKYTFALLCDEIIYIGLFFLLAVVPLIINPLALDYWYKPKIDSVYVLLVIIGTSTVIRYLFFKKPINLRKNPLTIPLVAYGSASILSTIFTISPKLSIHGDMFREEGIFTLLSYIALAFIFSGLTESEKTATYLLKALLVSTTIVSLYAIVQYCGFNPTEHFIPLLRLKEGRVGSTMGNPNFLGKFLVLVLPLFFAYYLTSTHIIEKALFLGGGMSAFSALLITFTRASWLGFVISIVSFLFLAGRKTIGGKKKEIVFIVIFFFCATAILSVQSSINKSRHTGYSIASVTKKIQSAFDTKKGMGVATRLFVWKKALMVIKERPFVGFGPDTHILVMKRFNLDYIEKFNDLVVIDRVHNNYLDIAIAQGLIGLGCYLSIVITFMIWLTRTIKKEKSPSLKTLYCGIFSAYCGYLVNDFFIFSVVAVSPAFWSLMGLTVSLKNSTLREITP